MTNIEQGWGAGPSAAFEELAAPYRPVFERIRATAVGRDLDRILPHEELNWLRRAGFTKLRLPPEQGGRGATLPELFGLLIELAEADPNVTNAVRAHFGLTEDVLSFPAGEWRDHWLARVAAGETVGSGHSETGESKLGVHSTTLRQVDGKWIVHGEKFYTTGSLFADWINVAAADENGEPVTVLVPTRARGVSIVNDWDGFGQALTASGTARFDNVEVAPESVKPAGPRFRHAIAFYQLVHLATLAGIGRSAARDVSALLGERRRVYTRGNASKASEDPQLLQVVGRVRSAAYAAGAIVLKAAEAQQRAYEAHIEGALDEEAQAELFDLAELEVSQSVTVVSSLILDATAILFDALGASATKRSQGLDRHWRNARTISSHNPRVYHDRIAGQFGVSGAIDKRIPGVGIAQEEKQEAAPASA